MSGGELWCSPGLRIRVSFGARAEQQAVPWGVRMQAGGSAGTSLDGFAGGGRHHVVCSLGGEPWPIFGSAGGVYGVEQPVDAVCIGRVAVFCMYEAAPGTLSLRQGGVHGSECMWGCAGGGLCFPNGLHAWGVMPRELALKPGPVHVTDVYSPHEGGEHGNRAVGLLCS